MNRTPETVPGAVALLVPGLLGIWPSLTTALRFPAQPRYNGDTIHPEVQSNVIPRLELSGLEYRRSPSALVAAPAAHHLPPAMSLFLHPTRAVLFFFLQCTYYAFKIQMMV